MDLFLTNMQLFTPQEVNRGTGEVWINRGLLWCFHQLFGLSFWRHPFTAGHPLVSKWCNAKLLHICSHEETFIYIFNGLRVSKCLYFKFWVNYSFTNDFTMLVQTAFFGHNGDLKWEITLQSECYQTNKQKKKSHFELCISASVSID